MSRKNWDHIENHAKAEIESWRRLHGWEAASCRMQIHAIDVIEMINEIKRLRKEVDVLDEMKIEPGQLIVVVPETYKCPKCGAPEGITCKDNAYPSPRKWWQEFHPRNHMERLRLLR